MQRMHRLAYYRQAPLVGVAPVYASVAAAVAAAGPVTCPYTGARGQGPARQVAAAGPVTAPRVATSAVAPEVAEAGPVAAPSIAAAGPAAVVRTMVPTLERAPPSAPLDDDEEVEEELQQGPPNMEPSPSVAPMPPPPAQYHLSPPRNHSADGSARRPLTDRPRRPRSTHGHAEIVSRPGSAHGAPNVRSTPIVTRSPRHSNPVVPPFLLCSRPAFESVLSSFLLLTSDSPLLSPRPAFDSRWEQCARAARLCSAPRPIGTIATEREHWRVRPPNKIPNPNPDPGPDSNPPPPSESGGGYGEGPLSPRAPRTSSQP